MRHPGLGTHHEIGGIFPTPVEAMRKYHDSGTGGVRAGGGLLEPDDAAADGECDRLRAIRGSRLVHDVLDVNLDRLLRGQELRAYVAAAETFRDVRKNFHFAFADIRPNLIHARAKSVGLRERPR